MIARTRACQPLLALPIFLIIWGCDNANYGGQTVASPDGALHASVVGLKVQGEYCAKILVDRTGGGNVVEMVIYGGWKTAFPHREMTERCIRFDGNRVVVFEDRSGEKIKTLRVDLDEFLLP